MLDEGEGEGAHGRHARHEGSEGEEAEDDEVVPADTFPKEGAMMVVAPHALPAEGAVPSGAVAVEAAVLAQVSIFLVLLVFVFHQSPRVEAEQARVEEELEAEEDEQRVSEVRGDGREDGDCETLSQDHGQDDAEPAGQGGG